jgi:hypothetical protein
MSYVKTADADFAAQLELYAKVLPKYQKLLSVSDADIKGAADDALYFRWALNVQVQVQAFSPSVTGFKDLLRRGSNNEVLTAQPVSPVFDLAPDMVAANVEMRYTKSADARKADLNYTTDIGKELGIVAATSVFVPNDGVCVLTVKLSFGGHPLLHYVKGKYEGAQIWKDSGDGKGFVLLATSIHPDYLDLTPLPAAGISATWKYKAILLYKDTQVGKWSAVIEITVAGV